MVSRAYMSQRFLASSAAFPPIQRDQSLQSLTAAHLQFFKSLLPPSAILTDPVRLRTLNTDWMNKYTGTAKLALLPTTTQQVSAIMRYCNYHRLPIVPQGGNTGLVGASVPVFDEIIISMSAMNRIDSFDPSSAVIITQPGVVLRTLDNFVSSYGYRIPIDIGARDQCQIGGNVATNAAGSRFVRYGSLRGSVIGLEAVLPNGRVLDTLTAMRKDNTGYDLKNLFIGSEGTLGVITRLAIACPVRSTDVHSMILQIDRFEDVHCLLQLSKSTLGPQLSAFEFMDVHAIRLANIQLPQLSRYFPYHPSNCKAPGLILIECAGGSCDRILEKLNTLLAEASDQGIISSGYIATSEEEEASMWQFRESLPCAVRKAARAASLKYDLSLPIDIFYACVEETRKRVAAVDGVHVVAWGHVGDGNLHLNVAVEKEQAVPLVEGRMHPWIYEFVAANGGSISAEHGLGRMKASAIGFSKSKEAVNVMRDVKNMFDPNGICNPYKMLP